MTNVISIKKRRKEKNKKPLNPMDIVDGILSNKTINYTKEVKRLLKDKGIKYRITHKEISTKVAPKNRAIMFPELKIVFIIGGSYIEKKQTKNWSIKYLKVLPTDRAFDLFEIILTNIEANYE